MHKPIVAAAAALLTSFGVCLAQPPGITREMIERALPLEGAPLAVPGPYKVVSEAAFDSPGHHVYRPESLDAFPKKDTLPVMVWGNGGCAIDSTRYGGFLTTIASHGFLVLGTVPQEGKRQETADDVRAAIDWAAKENDRSGSPLKGKIALDKVAVMGQSCGGFLAIVLGADPRVKTIGVFNSGVQTPPAGQAQGNGGRGGASPQPTADALAKVHGPVLLINGGEPDFMMATSAATFDLVNNVPAFYGARHNAGHTATVFHPGGGEFANVASNWLLWTFKGDKKAGAMFAGKNCSLCTNSNWDVKSKGIKK